MAFLAARERDLPLYRRLGLHGVYLGDEAIVRCDTFSLAGGAHEERALCGRRASGAHCDFRILRETEASPELLAATQRAARPLARGRG